MRKIKTSDDLCRMVNEELVQLKRSRRSPQYAPFRNPKIYREDYARDVLGVSIPLNESYPWSLKTRLLIEEAEGGIMDWFGGAVDWLFGLPGKVLGILTAFKDLVLNPGAIKGLAKKERGKWQQMLSLIDKQFKGAKYKKLRLGLTNALDAAISKVESEKGLTAACGTVALSLVVRYRGVQLLKEFGRSREAARITATESYQRYQSGGLTGVLLEYAGVPNKGKDTIRRFFPEGAEEMFGLLKDFLDESIYEPPSSFDEQAKYMANATKALRKKGRSGTDMNDSVKSTLNGLFARIWGDHTDNDDAIDPIAYGSTKSFDGPIAKAAGEFVRQLNEVASGEPQSGLGSMWSFLGKIGSSAAEGISMLWSLVKKYGKAKKVEDGTPGGVGGPEAAAKALRRQVEEVKSKDALKNSLDKNAKKFARTNPIYIAAARENAKTLGFGGAPGSELKIDDVMKNLDSIANDIQKLLPKLNKEITAKLASAKTLEQQVEMIGEML